MDSGFSLADFFETIADDPRIGANHIVVYLALRYRWELDGNPNVLAVDSFEMMRFAKIRKRDTYLKSLRELGEFGYVRYIPAENEYLKAEVVFKRL
ncbi:MAG: hypothetical protein V4557_12895 [Bacteroidota bacterium]